MFLFSGSAVFASNDINVIIDGERQSYDNDQPPVMKNNRTLVPLRGIFETLGAEIKWYSDTQTVEAIKGNTAVVLQIGSNIAYVNGEQVTLDQSAEIINGRTMVQLRFVSEALGAEVKWEGATSSVNITSNDEESIEIDEYVNNIHDYRYNLNLINYAIKGDYKQVERLLDAGTNVNAGITEKGVTPLIGAAKQGNLSIVNLLVDYGANINLKDIEGKTAIDYARANGHNKVAEFLEKTANTKSLEGFTYSKYSIDRRISADGYVTISGTIPSDEIKWVLCEVIKKDTDENQFVIFPVENNVVSEKVYLPYGRGDYVIKVYETDTDDWYKSNYTEILAFNAFNKYDSGVYISKTETYNSVVSINGKVAPQSDWLMFLINKKATDLYKEVYIPIENNQFSEEISLLMGPGEYIIYVYQTTDQDEYFHLNTMFLVDNLDVRDPFLIPSKDVESDAPEIMKLAKQITDGYDSDLAKSKAIYDWVAKNIVYDAESFYRGEDVSHSALETLQLGVTDCNGYARLTAALHRAVGIEAKIIYGDTAGEDRPFDGITDHVWNEVLINGEWIILDTTWGAGYLNPELGTFVPEFTRDYYDPTNYFFAETHKKLGELYE